MIACWLKDQPWYQTINNPYQSWVEMYANDEFQIAMQEEIDWINQRLANIDSQRFQQLTKIFIKATQLEADFWQMGLDKSY